MQGYTLTYLPVGVSSLIGDPSARNTRYYLLSGVAIASTQTQTPGERFEEAMKRLAEQCAKLKLPPNRTDCDPLKLRPADPMTTSWY